MRAIAVLVLSLALVGLPHAAAVVDADGDGLPDALEAHLCGSTIGAAEVAELQMHCEGLNLDLRGWRGLVRVPAVAAVGPDEDHDGFPAWVDLSTTEYAVQPEQGVATELPGPQERVVIDPNDADPSFPRTNTGGAGLLRPEHPAGAVCNFAPRASAVLWQVSGASAQPSPDATIFATTVCVDRRDPGVVQIDPAPWSSIVRFPSTPVNARIAAIWGPDGDGDGLPASLTESFEQLTLVDGVLNTLEVLSQRKWDPNDAQGAHLRSDTDRDGVPDDRETIACLLEDPSDPLDGTCVTGDYELGPGYVSSADDPRLAPAL